MAGVRIFCKKPVSIDSWDHDFVITPSKLVSGSPLAAISSFDLINPLDNSGNGFIANQGGGKVKDWGLNFENGSSPSVTDMKKVGVGAVSFLTAFRFTDITRFMHVISNRNTGVGFRFFYNSGFYLGITYPSGSSTSISAGGVLPAVKDKWYVAAGVFNPVAKTASVQITDVGTQYGDIGTAFPSNASLDSPLIIGGDVSGNTAQTMFGDVAFAAFYDGAFTTAQRSAMLSLGMEILSDRGLV